MQYDQDHYEIYYADKLWNLLPAIYRTLDTDSLQHNGPLREMVNRIGAQAAILRRSMDRMWEDQSIESCDDWVIPYIADLLATNLVASLDARGQRLDVAKTIYYRRRKGTVAILEEIAANITNWDARVVEFFRRLGRTRHSLDPEIGLPAETDDPGGNSQLQQAEGLIGSLTHSAIGGWANLRNVYGATKTNTAFDEYFHTADFRRGRGQVGWYNIPRLGVFLWRLISFEPPQTTPVPVHGCPGYYTFDPTGRNVPLFAAASRPYGDAWVSPAEWQLPTPISTPLLRADLQLSVEQQHLYAALDPADGVSFLLRSLGVFRKSGSYYDLVSPDQLALFPELGRFHVLNPPVIDAVYVTYHYGFSSHIGAGPYDRRTPGAKAPSLPAPQSVVSGGVDALTATNLLASLAPTGTIVLDDSLTYTSVSNVGEGNAIQRVALRAQNLNRPVLRLPAPAPDPTAWVFTGAAGSTPTPNGDLIDGVLTLDGLLISGGNIILRGSFDSVTLTCCTLDPGQAGDASNPPTVFAKAADDRDLLPCRVWVEADIRQLTIDRSIIGPVRTRLHGEIETLLIKDSIIQAIRSSSFGVLAVTDLKDPTRLAIRLRDARDPLSSYLKSNFSAATKQLLNAYDSKHNTQAPSSALQQAIVNELNTLLSGPSLYDASRFAQVPLSPEILQLMQQNPQGADLIRLNRLLLEAAYPLELDDCTIGVSSGTVDITRCTLLGPAYVHRLEASECILDDITIVEDAQNGCVRFSAWSTGSVLPRRYESVEIAPRVALFNTRVFGQPAYAQLQSGVDSAVLSPTGGTIAQGAQDGSEMGAFARDKNPIKERSLLIKYDEYMPLGLIPVIIYVT